jgi:histidine triad (HIT) family protein
MTIFSKIIKGEIPSHKIAEDENFYAFLDINPQTEGHTLVVPKKEIDYFFDLDAETLAGIMVFSQKVALALQKAIPCLRIGVSVIGLEVPHAHVHLIPMQSMRDMNFASPKLKPSQEELAKVAEKIRQFIK